MIEKKNNTVIKTCTAILVLAALASGAIAYDNTKADKEYVDEVYESVKQLSVGIRINNLQRRIWDLEERYGGPGLPNAPKEVKKEYQELKLELRSLEKKSK